MIGLPIEREKHGKEDDGIDQLKPVEEGVVGTTGSQESIHGMAHEEDELEDLSQCQVLLPPQVLLVLRSRR